MKNNKTILLVSSSILTAGMAKGAITYHYIDQSYDPSTSGYNLDLNGDGTNDYRVFFDASNASKPCVLGAYTGSGSSYPGSFPNPIPMVFNELNMNPVDPASNDNNGTDVIPLAATISSLITVNANTLTIGDLGGDMHGKNEAYLYQNGETTMVGQWPSGEDTVGYVGLALVDTNATPATTNYGWVQLELDYTQPTAKLTVIDYAYQTVANSNIVTGELPPIAPTINVSPTNQTVVAGSIVTMNVIATASPAPAYQWMAGAVGSGNYTNVPNSYNYFGVKGATLTISNAIPANQLDYVVVVTNLYGSITSSPPATLAVLGAGLAGPLPDRQVIYAGYLAQFTVNDLGGGARTNRWQLNNVDVNNSGGFSGATTTNLLISSVEPVDLGNYQAIVSTAYGSATSSMAPLGIAYPDGSLYESAVRAYGAMNYYRLNETSGTNAWDFIGGKTGIYKSPSVSFGNNGPTSAAGFPGFVSTNYAADFQADGTIDTNAYVTCLPWNFNTNTVTLTAWIYPTFREGQSGLNSGILCAVTNSSMICGIRYDGTYNNTNGIADSNIGYNWNNDALGAGSWNSQISAPHNEWSLIALTVSATNAVLYIINNSLGVQASEDVRSHGPVLFNTTEYIGTFPLEQPLGVNNFAGYIDEVAIFSSTLSSNQVYALYESALGQNVVPPGLTITPAGTNTQVRWTSGVLLQAPDLLGPWTTNMAATSPYTINPTSPQQFFRAKQ